MFLLSMIFYLLIFIPHFCLSTSIISHTVGFWCLNNAHKSAAAQMLTTQVSSSSVHLLEIFSWQAIKQLGRNNVSFTSLLVICGCVCVCVSWSGELEWEGNFFVLNLSHELNITSDNVPVIQCSFGHFSKNVKPARCRRIVITTSALFWNKGLQNPSNLVPNYSSS